jgi:GDP-L-fucose synthase
MKGFPFKRVTVTGGAGFLGTYVVRKLQTIDDVEVFVPRRVDFDLVEKAQVVRLFEEARPELVIHLAALVGGIGFNQENPACILYVNQLMGTQLIEQARLHGVKKFVALGTVCSYPKYTPVPFKEEELWNGYPEETNAPYGLAKKMMLTQLQAYRQQYGFNGIFLLPANLYGPGDNFDPASSHVIPALIRKCVIARRERQPYIEVWGNGEASREFLYVEDCAEGIIQAASLYDESLPVNLGNGREVLIKEVVAIITRLTRYSGEIRWQTEKPNGQPRRQLDTSRAFAKFGFRATTPLEEALRRTITWFEDRYP